MQGIHAHMHADIGKKKKKETMWGGGGVPYA